MGMKYFSQPAPSGKVHVGPTLVRGPLTVDAVRVASLFIEHLAHS
jgi:hypothetical protein